MPWCFGASGSVRTNRKHQSAKCAPEVHTFCPLTTNWSPRSTARVRRLARSPPASGSVYPWHHSSSALRMRGKWRFFCSSVPQWISVGPNRLSALAVGRTGARARKYSSSKMTCSIKPAPRAPYSLGQEIPTQPAACIVFCHAMRFSSVSRSGATRWSAASSTQISGGRFAASHCRNSARNSACSGLSAKSMAPSPSGDYAKRGYASVPVLASIATKNETGSDDAGLPQLRDFAGGETKPAAIDLGIVLTDPRARPGLDLVGAVEPQWCRRHDDFPQFGVIYSLEHAALMHVRVVHDLRGVAHRRARDAVGLGAREHLHLGEVRVQASTNASVSSIWATRPALVAKRGSSARSSRPIALSRFWKCASVTIWIATWPSAVGKTL